MHVKSSCTYIDPPTAKSTTAITIFGGRIVAIPKSV